MGSPGDRCNVSGLMKMINCRDWNARYNRREARWGGGLSARLGLRPLHSRRPSPGGCLHFLFFDSVGHRTIEVTKDQPKGRSAATARGLAISSLVGRTALLGQRRQEVTIGPWPTKAKGVGSVNLLAEYSKLPLATYFERASGQFRTVLDLALAGCAGHLQKPKRTATNRDRSN